MEIFEKNTVRHDIMRVLNDPSFSLDDLDVLLQLCQRLQLRRQEEKSRTEPRLNNIKLFRRNEQW